MLGVIAYAVNRPRGVETAEGDLNRPAAGLESATGRWQSSLEEEGFDKAAVAKASCRYLVTEQTGIATDQLACGPFRRPKAAAGAVWDLVPFARATDGEVKLATDLKIKAAQGLPAGSQLVDGSGHEVEVSTDVPEQETPRLTRDALLSSGDDFSLDSVEAGAPLKPPAPLRLVGLEHDYRLSVREVTAVDRWFGNGRSGPVQAAKGQKLYLVQIDDASPEGSAPGTDLVTLRQGEEELDVVGLDTSDRVLVSSPGKGLVLQMESEGAKQSLDVFTGKRSSDPRTEPLYTRGYPVTGKPGTAIAYPRVTVGGVTYDVDVKVTEVEVTPYRNGWAPAGQVAVRIALDADAAATVSNARYTTDCTATIAGGTVSECGSAWAAGATITGTAPAGKPIELSFTPTLKVDRSGAKSDVVFPARSASVPLP